MSRSITRDRRDNPAREIHVNEGTPGNWVRQYRISHASEDLLQARDLSLANPEQVCEQAARWDAFDAATLHRYFTTALNFTLTDRHLAGITEFTTRMAGQRSGFPPQAQLHLFQAPSRK